MRLILSNGRRAVSFVSDGVYYSVWQSEKDEIPHGCQQVYGKCFVKKGKGEGEMEEGTSPFIPCQLFFSNEKGLQLNKLRQ